MMKVCWISNAPSPYKVDFMNLLGEKVDLICLFEVHAEKDREAAWYKDNFEHFRAVYLDTTDAKKEIRMAAEECDCLINSDYSKSICMYAVRQFHKHNKTVFLHADGGLAIPRGIMDKVISQVMKQSDYFLSSGKEVNKYFQYYGIPEDRILTYRFSPLSEKELKEHAEMHLHKDEYRQKCAFKENIMLLSVGQQIPRKGYDILVQAMKSVDRSIGLTIIGGEPEDRVKKIVEDNHFTNVHFIPFLSKEKLSEYYAASDIFVMPTRYDIWGLVINEAMSFGLPIISTDKCVAALEFNRIGHNAVIVHSEDICEMSKAIDELSKQNNQRMILGENSQSTIEDYSLENMTEDIFANLKTKNSK